jgi:hypothetical protein
MLPTPVPADRGSRANAKMSTVKIFERNCAYCRQLIRLNWKERLIPPDRVRLVFHDECWDKYCAKYDRKRTRPEALAEG